MEEKYSEIRDYLRKQHSENRNEVRSRYRSNGYMYHYDEDEYSNDYNEKQKNRNKTGSNFIFFCKIVAFLVAVLTFSCYIYGEQNLKKGFDMAVSETKEYLLRLENDNEVVRETMAGVRSTWHKVKDYAEEYMQE